MNMKKMELSKEHLVPQMKQMMVPELKKEMKAKGVTGFRFVDMEWTENGLTIYYEDTARGPVKGRKK